MLNYICFFGLRLWWLSLFQVVVLCCFHICSWTGQMAMQKVFYWASVCFKWVPRPDLLETSLQKPCLGLNLGPWRIRSLNISTSQSFVGDPPWQLLTGQWRRSPMVRKRVVGDLAKYLAARKSLTMDEETIPLLICFLYKCLSVCGLKR